MIENHSKKLQFFAQNFIDNLMIKASSIPTNINPSFLGMQKALF